MNTFLARRARTTKAIVLSLLVFMMATASVMPAPAAAQTQQQLQQAKDQIECMAGAAPFVGQLFCAGKEIVGTVATAAFGIVMQGVGYVVLSIANFLLYLIGVLFNYVIIYTVFQFGNYFGNSEGLLAAWGILRDVANIILIFGFVMLGVATMLDVHGYEVRKTLPRLIIFAILMNFSLLASEAVIDTANAFASVFYTQASKTCQQGEANAKCIEDATNGGISAEIVQMAGLTSIFSTPPPNGKSASSTDETSSIQWGTIYIGMGLFVTVLCVVLLVGSILLITRAVMLAILMILSPLGFAGLAIPPLEKYALEWWHRLLSQAFFAPVYLLFIFVALKMVKGLSGGTVSVGSALTSGSTGAIGSVLIFSILIGFLIAALMVAKNMGAIGASFATSMATKVVGYPFAAIGRQTAGRGAAATARVFQGWVGSQNKGAVGRAAAGTLKFFGADQAIHGGLKKVSGASVGGFASFDKDQEDRKKFAKESEHAAESNTLRAALDANQQKTASDVAQKMDQHGLEEFIKTSTDRQVAALAGVLSPDRVDKLIESGEVKEHQKSILIQGKLSSITSNNLKNVSVRELEFMAKNDPSGFDRALTARDPKTGQRLVKDDMLDKLSTSERLTATQRTSAKNSTDAGQIELHITTGNHAAATAVAQTLDPKEKARLRGKDATHPAVMATWSAVDMDTLMAERKVRDPAAAIAWLKANATQKQRAEINTYLATNHFAASLWGAKSI